MRYRILLLCNKPNENNDASTVIEHITSIEKYSKHQVFVYSNISDFSNKLELSKFDIIIIHYSISLLKDYFLSRKAKTKLREFNGLKIIFLQDEYRQINKMISELAYLNVDVLFTCFPSSEIKKIYTKEKLPNVSKYNNLTGYIPSYLINIQQPFTKDRPLHVGYRGRQSPFWYGELGYEKWNIVEKWKQYATRSDLRTDLSYHEKDRIYGQNWIKFLSSCKTTLGVESGASVMDFTGKLEKIIDNYQLLYPHDSFHDVQKKYFLAHEGKYKLNQISPRCFEAIALKTVLVLYEGEYSDILVANRHYIELKKDFSNIEKVLNQIRDDDFLQNMADVAYQEIALNPNNGYPAFVEYVDEVISTEFLARSKKKVQVPYEKERFLQDIKAISLKSKFYKNRLTAYQKLPVSIRLIVKACFKPKLTAHSVMKRFFRVLYSSK